MENKIIDISPKERILLSGIRKRPPMYVGEYSLSKLVSFFHGYESALYNYGMDKQFCIIPEGFNEFVLKEYGLSGTIGYFTAILMNCPDGKETIEIFFNLLDKFLEINGFEKIQ